MRNGIYKINFETPGDSGDGLMTVRNSAVNGGDASFLYKGTLQAANGELAGTIKISQWRAGNPSVFGTTGNFELIVTGKFDDASGLLSGKGDLVGSPGRSLKFSGEYLTDIAE